MTLSEQANTVTQQLSNPWVIAIVGGAIDMAMRIFKTKEPKSLLYMVANTLNTLANLFTKISAILDKVVQNVEDKPKLVDAEVKKDEAPK